MERLISAYAGLLKQKRRYVAAAVILVTAFFAVSVLQLRTDDQLLSALSVADPLETPDERALLQRTENTCLVLLSGEEPFSATGISVIRKLDETLARIDGVEDVESLNDVRVVRRVGKRRMFLMLLPGEDADSERIESAKERAAEHPFVAGHLLTEDGLTTSIGITIKPEIQSTAGLRKVIGKIRATVAEVTAGTKFEAEFTGMPVIRVQNSDVVVQDQIIFNVVGAFAGFVVNCLLLRRLVSVAIVSAGSWLGVFWTFGLFGALGQPLSAINGIVAPLAMTIGLTDSIHLLLDIRRMREKGLSRVDAVVAGVRDVGLACTLTTLTTVVGFLSLTVADLAILRNLGVCCAMAVGSAYFSVLTVVPLLCTTRLGDQIMVPQSDGDEARSSFASRLAALIVRWRWVVFTGGVAATVFLGFIAAQLRPDIRIAYALPKEAREVLSYSDQLFRGTVPVLLHVEWSEEPAATREQVIGVLQELHCVLGESRIMSAPLSLLSVLELFPAEEGESLTSQLDELRYWPEDARDLRDLAIDFQKRSMFLYLRCQDAGTATITEDLNDFTTAFGELREEYPGFTFRILNSTIMSAPVADQIVKDLMRSLMLAIPITLLIMAWALRSTYYGLAGLLPNVFPMVALAAALVLTGQPLMLVGAVVFTISFGVAVDDTIHVLSNFKKRLAELNDPGEAIAAVYSKVGSALVFSTLILFAGMGVVMLSRTQMVRTFGGMFCIALGFALIADLILLPAVLACFPPRLKPKRKGPKRNGDAGGQANNELEDVGNG